MPVPPTRSLVSTLVGGAGLLLSAAVAPLAAQDGTISREENLRAEPNGVVVSVVSPGTPVAILREQGNWLEVAVEGWIWRPSTMAWDRGIYDMRVSADGGENLRSEPNGPVLAVMEEGALLQETDRVPGWSRVRRQAWIWAPSVERRAEPARPAPPAAADRTTAEPVAAPASQGVFRAESSAPVLGSPNGDTLGVLAPGAELSVTGRQGNWARVRVEGWVWVPDGQPLPGVAEVTGEDALAVDLETVLSNPDGYDGRIVTWTLQFVSLESAEAIRTDFYEGEPFLLTRPLDERNARFIYVALPPEALGQAAGLTPLEEITVVGRIRTGASALTGSPVLDLVELRRTR